MPARRDRAALTQRLLEPARLERRAAAAAAAAAARGRALRLEMVDVDESWKRRTDYVIWKRRADYLLYGDGPPVPIFNTAAVDRIAAKSRAFADDVAVQQANHDAGVAVGLDEGHHAVDDVEVAADEFYEL